MTWRKLSLVLAVFGLSVASLTAQSARPAAAADTLTARRLPSTVVSARRAPREVRASTPLFALDTGFIARMHLHGAADLVRHLPSATVRDYGGASGLKTVSVRALGATHTAVVVDGMPVSDLLSGAIDLSRLPLGRIAGMSLAMGAGDDLLLPPSARSAATLCISTVLPAPNASTSEGREKLTPRKFKLSQTKLKLSQTKFELSQTKFSPSLSDGYATAEKAPSTPPFRTVSPLRGDATLCFGQWGEQGAELSLGRALVHGWTTAAGLQWRRAAGNYPFTLTNHNLVTHPRRTHNLFQQAAVELRAQRSRRPETGNEASGAANEATGAANEAPTVHTDIKMSVRHDYRQLPGPVVYYNSARGTEHVRDTRAEASARHELRRCRWRLTAAGRASWDDYRYRDRDAQQPGGLLERQYTTTELYTLGGAALGFGRTKTGGRPFQAALVFDYTFQHLSSSMRSADGATRHSLHAAASLCYAAGPWQLTSSLGALAIDGRGPHSGPKAQAVHGLRPEAAARVRLWRTPSAETALRLYWRRTQRPPTFADCYFYRLGSTELRAEGVRQVGLGLLSRAEAARGALRLQFVADLYAQTLTDRISALPLSPALWRLTNRGRASGLGLDASAHVSARLAPRHAVEAAAALSCSGLRDRSDPLDAAYGRRPAYSPALWGSASAFWRNPWVDVRLWLTVQGRRWSTDEHVSGTSLPAAAELGAGLARSLRWGRTGGEVSAECLNLTDTQYEIIRRYPMPGRTWRVALRFFF